MVIHRRSRCQTWFWSHIDPLGDHPVGVQPEPVGVAAAGEKPGKGPEGDEQA